MSDVGDAIEEVRAELAAASPEFMADLCSLVTSTEVPDEFGGTITTLTTIASGVPCSHKPMSRPMQRQIGGGPITTLTHEVTMGADAITKNIKPDYQIVVEAHDDIEEITFEMPSLLMGSLSPFVKLAAVLAA